MAHALKTSRTQLWCLGDTPPSCMIPPPLTPSLFSCHFFALFSYSTCSPPTARHGMASLALRLCIRIPSTNSIQRIESTDVVFLVAGLKQEGRTSTRVSTTTTAQRVPFLCLCVRVFCSENWGLGSVVDVVVVVVAARSAFAGREEGRMKRLRSLLYTFFFFLFAPSFVS